ncbi:integral membrane protein [Beutenbergia cavernae DSM 12333]|uniref:Integral membrane protein n=1 Tax=Beutenbergia cavernae (strain ATCC BAA-8 / DSM 12333 / CCUG 43141 / JCM 11478 / NBRC 16432 / NCIMB 13614 / HKI 0122) TaxID=471853 RepID=C5C3Y7_BEUC1|nr:membrane protein [Beutenbergia cavernae]ACQ79900.1 integral membrane protein [Beutenbergia cavernae DSM 12333]
MTAALLWGAVAASSLLIGAVLGVVRDWPRQAIGGVLAFGAGALISAVSFDLASEGARLAGAVPVSVGLAVGALTYVAADRLLDRLSERRRTGGSVGTGSSSGSGSGSGTALALGAFLDGIPEQAVLGIGLAIGDGVSVGLLAAIFVSNLPESVGAAVEMRASGHSRAWIVRLWLGIAVVCAAATVAGWAIADVASPTFQAAVDGFAAGALLVMLIDSMIPEAARKAGMGAGLFAVLGFAVAAALTAFG